MITSTRICLAPMSLLLGPAIQSAAFNEYAFISTKSLIATQYQNRKSISKRPGSTVCSTAYNTSRFAPCRYSMELADGGNNEVDEIWKTVHSNKPISNLLVVGDGDLSYSASISRALHEFHIDLIATVLEDPITHQNVYKRSVQNQEVISSFENHQVLFGVDATKLQEHFPGRNFDRIQFNFPHWKGKANHRYNRQLIDSFLKSASEMLSLDGEIHMTLVEGQCGYSAKTLAEYRDSWTPSDYAGQHNLLLYKVMPFEVTYNLSSHRGVDRGFKIGSEPKTFIFSKARGTGKEYIIPKENQMCCRHEIHVVLPDEMKDDDLFHYTWDDITSGDAIRCMIQNVVPDGIRVEVPSRNILFKKDTGYDSNMAVFLVVYCGEGKAMKRDEADEYRHLAESEIEKHLPLRENRKGRLVSKPFPYSLLDSILKDNASYGLMKARY